MSENIFADEWIDCLKAHYMHVIRTKDHVTEPSLSIVMHSAGFSDAQLAELRVRATMHVDDVGADFVPDLDVLDEHDHQHSTPEATETHVYNIPIEAAQPQPEVSEALETEATTDDEAAPEAESEAELLADDDPLDDVLEEDDPDAPQQLSLF